jgi:hypothetical protein
MARGKPKIAPTVLRIESLSDGGVQPSAPIISDFDGEVIEPKPVQGPTKPLLDGQERVLEDRRKAVLNKRLLLEHVGMLPKSAEYAQARAEGTTIKQSVLVPKLRLHSKHQAFELTFPPKPRPKWRKL